MPSHLQLGRLRASCNGNMKAGQAVDVQPGDRGQPRPLPSALPWRVSFRTNGRELRPNFKGLQQGTQWNVANEGGAYRQCPSSVDPYTLPKVTHIPTHRDSEPPTRHPAAH